MISVIIPTYNEENVIVDCLQSLLKQKMRDFEIIVVDDGSTDSTTDKVNAVDSSKVKIFTQDHKGPAAARNLGANNAKGEILVFVDADMTFEKVFLRKLVAPIINGSTIGTFSKEEYVSNWNNVWARCWNWNLNLPSKRRLPLKYPDTQKVFRAILKKSFKNVGGFDNGGYTDDWTLSEKLHVLATHATGARFYHKNPDNLSEVFIQSRWVGKRRYKLGIIGIIIALVRVSFPLSAIVGVIKSILHRDSRFLLFKFIADLGVFVGVLSFAFTKKGNK